MAASPNGSMLLTRGTDHTLKVWDVRQLQSPVAVHEGLHNHYSTGACMFSPDSSLCVALLLLLFTLLCNNSTGT